jgi:hypothetical protein
MAYTKISTQYYGDEQNFINLCSTLEIVICIFVTNNRVILQ